MFKRLTIKLELTLLQFEAFPLVFIDIYHFNLGVGSLPFIGFVVTGAITVSQVYYLIASELFLFCLRSTPYIVFTTAITWNLDSFAMAA